MKDTLPRVIFISGTDTDAGKSYATGWLARTIAEQGESVITQKLIQTGNKDFSEDIDVHRKVMGIGMQPRDLDHTTAPLILSYPASPHLAAMIDHCVPDYTKAEKSAATLCNEYDHVLVEGAGGLMVPLLEDLLTIDFVKRQGWPVLLVTNGRLGSISHTLLALDALANRDMDILGLIYNPYFDKDKIIAAETRKYLQTYLAQNFPGAKYMEMPEQL